MRKLSEAEIEKIMGKANNSKMSNEDFRILFGYLSMPNCRVIAAVVGKSEHTVSESVNRLRSEGWIPSELKESAE